MRRSFYYQPVFRAIAKNGSERFGVNAVTIMWDESSKIKAELTVHGPTAKEALEKLKATLRKSDGTEPTELPCEYYLCSEAVVKHFKPFEVSKPFLSGYDYEKEPMYVAWLNFKEFEEHYQNFVEPDEDNQPEFSCRECVPGTMDVNNISMRNAKKIGLMREICQKINISSYRNQAMTICNLAEKYSCSPVQLINKYL